MALHLYQSNRLVCLLELVFGVISVPQLDPFAPELVLVQSKGMGRWLGFQLAKRYGVCANVQFPLPASFLWQLMQRVLGNLPRQSVFSTEVLTWRIFAWLGDASKTASFGRLQHYLQAGDEVRRYELAFRIADIFDQYLVYRPDWVARWEQGSCLQAGGLVLDEDWQRALWQDLTVGQVDFHRATLVDRLLAGLPQAAQRGDLPERVTLFAMSSLPPRYMAVFEQLAQWMDVCFFALNPCQESWGDIRDAAEQARLGGGGGDLYLAAGNPLLAAWGKQGRVFFDQLAGVPHLHSLFDGGEANPTCLLHGLQVDVLTLRDRGDVNAPTYAPPRELLPTDRSLQVHVCCSAMREVEVLYEQLLRLFAQDPSLTPADVAVLTPDIEVYAPLVEAVFALPRGDDLAIPYAVADKGLRAQTPLLDAWLRVVSGAGARVTAEMVLAWLEIPAIARQVGITQAQDLARCRAWLEAAGVRWGYDAADRERFGLPGSQEHTWLYGLQRLLLGFALPPVSALVVDGRDAVPLWQEVAPLPVVEGQGGVLLAALVAWVCDLFARFEQWQTPCPLVGAPGEDTWIARLQASLTAWFAPDAVEAAAVLALQEKLGDLGDVARRAGFFAAVSFVTVFRWVKAALAQPSNSSGFLTGAVTFCTMVPMRTLPFRVVCVLGLNDGQFPRQQPPLGFDLIGRFPRAGDRSRRLDDRYLFLETLLSAGDVLYLSYVGRDSGDNCVRPPSVLVSDLLEVACRSVVVAKAQAAGESSYVHAWDQIVTEHPLQPFDGRYFQQSATYPTFSRLWLSAACQLSRSVGDFSDQGVWFTEPLPVPEDSWREVDLQRLQSFFSNPSRFLLRQRLQLNLVLPQMPIPADEPFKPDYWACRAIQVTRQCYEENQAYALSRARGELPHGVMGKAWYAAVTAPVTMLQPHYPSEFLPPCVHAATLDVPSVGQCRLSATFDTLTSEGAWYLSAVPLSSSQYFSMWLTHVFLCYFKPSVLTSAPQTVVLTVEYQKTVAVPKRLIFKALTQESAGEILHTLLQAYWYGLQQPLPFFVRLSGDFAKNTAKQDSAALKKAQAAWQGSEQVHSPGDDVYHQLAWRGKAIFDETFVQWATALWQPVWDVLQEDTL